MQQYTVTTSKAEFIADVQLQDSVIRRLMVIAEAARRISPATRDRLDNIAWHEINGMRNRLVHEYNEIDFDLVWSVVESEVPELISILEAELP
ncbi:MAG: HepT-like ribonuclease domain-containing protein [Cyanobacteria bacterium P01_D01_bin.73]